MDNQRENFVLWPKDKVHLHPRVCIIADDFFTWFVRIISNESFTSLVVLIENDTWSTNNVLFEQLINIFILWIKKMKFCRRIGDGIQTDSHGNSVKFIHVFNTLNRWGHVQIIIPLKIICKS